MPNKILKILWVIIIFLFIFLQIYNLIRANYADVVTALLTVIIMLAMITAYWLIARKVDAGKIKKEEKPEVETKESNNQL